LLRLSDAIEQYPSLSWRSNSPPEGKKEREGKETKKRKGEGGKGGQGQRSLRPMFSTRRLQKLKTFPQTGKGKGGGEEERRKEDEGG